MFELLLVVFYCMPAGMHASFAWGYSELAEEMCVCVCLCVCERESVDAFLSDLLRITSRHSYFDPLPDLDARG